VKTLRNLLPHLLILMTVVLMWNRCTSGGNSDREHTLKVYNWADYIDESVLTEFEQWYEQQTGEQVHVVYQTFDINETMLTQIEKGKEDYDLVCPSDYMIERMMNLGLLLPIDTTLTGEVNYLNNVSPYISKEMGSITAESGARLNEYTIGYMWGTTGILYNADSVGYDDVQSWAVLWNPAYKGKILMKDSGRDTYAAAAIYAYRQELAEGRTTPTQVINDTSDEAIARVEALLKAQKPLLFGWEVDFGKEYMTKGKALLNLAWSGDAIWAMDEAALSGVRLDYAVPAEGSNIWFDGWVIPKYAQNVKAAHYFINFLCRPDIALRNMEAIGYVSTVATPEILQAVTDSTLTETVDASYFFGSGSDSVLVNPIMYPPLSVVQKCGIMRDFGARNAQVFDMWSNVKGNQLSIGIILVIVCVLGGIAGYSIYAFTRKSRRNRKAKKSPHKRA